MITWNYKVKYVEIKPQNDVVLLKTKSFKSGIDIGIQQTIISFKKMQDLSYNYKFVQQNPFCFILTIKNEYMYM